MDKNKFLLGIMVAMVGLFMLLEPDSFIKFAVIILGVALIFDGIFILVAVRTLVTDKNYGFVMALHGALSIVVGLLAVLLPLVLSNIFWKIMAYTISAYLVAAAIMELYAINMLSRNGISTKKSIFEVIICLVLAIILFMLPAQRISHLVVYVCGVILLVFGIAFALVQWKLQPIIIQPDSIVDDIPADEAISGTAEEPADAE